MGQVPAPLGIIGDGRMARHFTHYLGLEGVAFRQWSRRAGGSVEHALADCDRILLLIRDDAIGEFLLNGVTPAFRDARAWAHFSGSLVTPHARGSHPLMTFGDGNFYGHDEYRRIPFVVEASSPEQARARFAELFPSLANPVYPIAPEAKPLYHALCVMSGNFTTALWAHCFRELEIRLGIPRGAAHPYLDRIAANLRADAERALTGPLARRDFGTLARNRAALAGIDDPLLPVFDAFVEIARKRSIP